MSIFSRYPKSTFLRDLRREKDPFCLQNRIEDLYTYIAGKEDLHFGIELDHDCHSRIWEMMVAKILVIHGLDISSLDAGPDFQFDYENQKIHIEAVCPGLGDDDNPDAVPPLQSGVCGLVPTEQILLRFASAIKAKADKYLKYLELGIIRKDEPCLIAISSSKFHSQAEMDPCVGIRCTLGYSSPYAIIDRNTMSIVEEDYGTQLSVQKSNKVPIRMIPFPAGELPHIAGIIYSDDSMFSGSFNLPSKSVFIHNPRAEHPIPAGIFKLLDEVYTIVCIEDEVWRSFVQSRQILPK